MILNRNTLATINHEPGPCFFTLLALSTHHEPDRCCLRLCRSTYHGSHPWFLVLEDENWCVGTWIYNFLFISHCYGFMESFRKSVYKLFYFVDFWGYFVTFIFGYISSTTYDLTRNFPFSGLTVLCIVIFVYVHNYSILFFFSCACHENFLYWHSNFWGCEVNF